MDSDLTCNHEWDDYEGMTTCVTCGLDLDDVEREEVVADEIIRSLDCCD